MYIKHKPIRADFISLPWYVGSVCNYNCSYCIPEFNNGKQPFPDRKPYMDFIDKVRDKYPDKRLYITLYGGEVTLWNQFKEFVTECQDRNVAIRLVTNGAMPIKWWKEVTDKIHYISISYHMEYASEDHILELVKLRNRFVQINFMLPHDRFDEGVEIAQRLSEKGKVFVIPKFLRVGFGQTLYPYTEEQVKYFQTTVYGTQYLNQGKYGYSRIMKGYDDGTTELIRNARVLYLQKLNRWEGWHCWGGIQQMFVDYYGDIYVGQCRRGKFGNIYDGIPYELPDKPFICDKEICNCTQDILDCDKEKL